MNVAHGSCGQRPIAVFPAHGGVAPGAVVPSLREFGREVVMIRVMDGDPVPSDPGAYEALASVGGYMSAHDPLS